MGKCKALCSLIHLMTVKESPSAHFYEGALKLKTIELSMLMPKLQSRVSRIEAKVKTEPCAELKIKLYTYAKIVRKIKYSTCLIGLGF